jgi:hypothetical protein
VRQIYYENNLTENDDPFPALGDSGQKKVQVFNIDLGDDQNYPCLQIASFDVDELTVGWLYSEFFRKMEEMKNKNSLPDEIDDFLFFKSGTSNSALDLYLTQFENKLSEIPNNTWLYPVYKEKVPSDGFISYNHFQVLKKIGQGGFGDVWLVRRKDTGHLYAMKMIAKKHFNVMHCRIIKRELKLMKDLDHPFVVKMHYSFYNDESYFFVMDFCPGKDLFTLIGGGVG